MKGRTIIVKNLSKKSKEKLKILIDEKEKRLEDMAKQYKDKF